MKERGGLDFSRMNKLISDGADVSEAQRVRSEFLKMSDEDKEVIQTAQYYAICMRNALKLPRYDALSVKDPKGDRRWGMYLKLVRFCKERGYSPRVYIDAAFNCASKAGHMYTFVNHVTSGSEKVEDFFQRYLIDNEMEIRAYGSKFGYLFGESGENGNSRNAYGEWMKEDMEYTMLTMISSKTVDGFREMVERKLDEWFYSVVSIYSCYLKRVKYDRAKFLVYFGSHPALPRLLYPCVPWLWAVLKRSKRYDDIIYLKRMLTYYRTHTEFYMELWRMFEQYENDWLFPHGLLGIKAVTDEEKELTGTAGIGENVKFPMFSAHRKAGRRNVQILHRNEPRDG